MTTAALRAAMIPVTRRVRAYFAPIERGTEAPTIFDPAQSGVFLLDDPPTPWLDLGWIDNFERSSATASEMQRAGISTAQFRGVPSAQVEFDFREWGKLQMALACGAEHMNVLTAMENADAQPSGGSAQPAVAVLAGSTASEIVCGVGAVDGFSAGDLVAVDVDYLQQTGYVGTRISAAYVADPADVKQDVNYVRRVTFNVGRVAGKTSTSLLLAQPLLGGAPAGGSGIQKVVGFVDREGGAFFQTWSALFVAEEESGGRVCFHYPRLSPVNGTASMQREASVDIARPLAALMLHARFQALPHTDENDGKTVVCYRTYFPSAMAAVY